MAEHDDDGSRIEAAAAGVHADERELDDHGDSDRHAGPAAGRHRTRRDTRDDHDDHVGHDDHEDDEGGHGHGADPNAGVLLGTPPTPAWVQTAVGIALITAVICAIVAVLLHNAAQDSGGSPEEATTHGLAPVTSTIGRV